ncbi:HEAT repeat domain-containing protein [Kitasatospora sp. NPDC004614]|uniref:HEAT repeat domain-containing protein n=1 Tax=unclassified Kitasatospora TaxID=2633591 RepID=UPI003692F45E
MWSEEGMEFHAGTVEDVRFVVAHMPVEVKNGFVYGAVPWSNFSHAYGPGSDVPDLLEQARTGDERSSNEALSKLSGRLLQQGTSSAAGALAIPFLVRIVVALPFHRAGILRVIAGLVRRQYFGDGSRTGLLRAARADDQIVFEPSGYLANWSVQAAREALAADAGLLLPLLGDPDPEVRQASAYALAAVPNRPASVADCLSARFQDEEDPAVRACLVLAIGQLAWEERHPDTIDQMCAWWQDCNQPAEVRVCAALTWLCLTDGPVPDNLRAFLELSVTDDLAALLESIPWLDHIVDGGLRRCLDQMFYPEKYPHFTSCLD